MQAANPAQQPIVGAGHAALRALIAAGFSSGRIEQVLTCYDEPQRHYHRREHLREMLDLSEQLCLPLSPAQALALLYHDAVYVPGAARGSNELLSAQLLRVQGAGLAPGLVEMACSIIVDTAEHLASSEPARLVVDLDLIRLGGSAQQFDFFSRQVFAEQRALFDDTDEAVAWQRFQQRRMPFFRRLLDRDRIFAMAPMRLRFEDAARANLRQALDSVGVAR